MSDIKLNHANIDEAADALTQASSGMHSRMEDCLRAVQTAEHQLQGDLATAAHEFYTALANSDAAMTDDIAKGAEVLRTMHGLLRDADAKGGQGIGQ
ncbi:hypothetical protein [Kitasatospora sp. NPDC057223]|uniref:hypothetical protein n=1 Tax=Kitasatospora sp. NPDC057223 TaxID=3346055 RepID=UPI003643865B